MWEPGCLTTLWAYLFLSLALLVTPLFSPSLIFTEKYQIQLTLIQFILAFMNLTFLDNFIIFYLQLKVN
jgi:hypothetical protein